MDKFKQVLKDSWEKLKQVIKDMWENLKQKNKERKVIQEEQRAIKEELNRVAREERRVIEEHLRGNTINLPYNRILNTYQILHLTKQGEFYISERLNYKGPYTLVDEEYIPDITSVSKKKGWVGRTVVGGVLAGPVGAIIGATTRKTETKTTDNSVLMLVVEDKEGKQETLALRCYQRDYIRWRQIL